MGVLNGDGRLVGQRLEHQQITIIEGVQLVALNVEHADDFPLRLDGHSKLRAGFAAPHPDVVRLLAHVGHQEGLTCVGHPACDPLLAHFEACGLEFELGIIPQETGPDFVVHFIPFD